MVDEYYTRCARAIEKMREHVGMGYGEGDIERLCDIMIARSNKWDEYDREFWRKQKESER